MMMKSFDKAPTITINGETVKMWNNGEYGSIGMRGENVVFKPYCFNKATNEVTEYIVSNHPNIILATGFTAYQYAHPDDADSMQHYYDKCKEEYKATLKYKAYYDEKIFAAVHIKDEDDKAEKSQILYEYTDDQELKELADRYLKWVRSKHKEYLMMIDLKPFFTGENPQEQEYNTISYVQEIMQSDRKAKSIAIITKRYINYSWFIRDYKQAPLWTILDKHQFPIGSQNNWSKAILSV